MDNNEAGIIEAAAQQVEGAETQAAALAFADLGLKIGDRMILEPPPKLGTTAAVVRLIGYLADQSVLVTMPDTRAWAGPPIEGDALGVRTFAGRHAYGFTTFVLRRSVHPYEHLHLEFPKRISVRQIRNAERIATSIQGRVMMDTPVSTEVINLSATGAEVREWEGAGEVGSRIQLEMVLDIHQVRTRLLVDALTRNRHQAADGGWAWGVEFCDVNAQTSIFLKSFVYQHLVEAPHRRL